MPYCTECDRFYNPNTLTSDGDCPDGHHVADPDAPSAGGAVSDPPPVPWHFKLMLTFIVIYLGWRLLQLLGVVADAVI